MNAITKTPGTSATSKDEHQRLLAASKQLEGVFFEQLLKAMRETVPDDGVIDGGSGEEMFTSMLDQNVAAKAPDQWRHGLSEALYRQLSRMLPPDSPVAPDAKTR